MLNPGGKVWGGGGMIQSSDNNRGFKFLATYEIRFKK